MIKIRCFYAINKGYKHGDAFRYLAVGYRDDYDTSMQMIEILLWEL